MQPVVFETKNVFFSNKKRKLLYTFVFSIRKIYHVTKDSQNIINEEPATVANLLIKASLYKLQRVAWKNLKLGINIFSSNMDFILLSAKQKGVANNQNGMN